MSGASREVLTHVYPSFKPVGGSLCRASDTNDHAAYAKSKWLGCHCPRQYSNQKLFDFLSRDVRNYIEKVNYRCVTTLAARFKKLIHFLKVGSYK